jgi:viologen exporter family transport system ATP-binding protein
VTPPTPGSRPDPDAARSELVRPGPRRGGAGIEVAGLRKEFRTRHGRVAAVAGIEFRVEPGEFVGYAGPNGAGKSTTVKMMSGVLVPSAGSVTVDGLVPWRERRKLARRMGVVFGQRTQLWWDLPLVDSLDLVRHLYRMEEPTWRRRLDELAGLLGLGPLLPQPVRALSLGQRMRAELAAAVLPGPRVLFLDEPTIGLDVEAKAAVRGFLRHLNEADGTTIILTTHDLDDITQLCSRLIIIDHGGIVYDGTIDELHTAYGSTRMLVVDLADPTATLTTGPDWAGATVVRADGHRRWIRFARDQISAARLVTLVLDRHQVIDLSIVEPDIEDVIRRIYRGEILPATDG